MVYVANFVKQLDGSAFQSANCMAASDAMMVNRVHHGQSPSAARIRTLSGDRSGGLNQIQVQGVDTRYFGFTPRNFQPIAWTDVLGLAQDRGFLLSIGYGPIRYTKYDCFRHRFADNHAIWVNHRTATGFRAADPGADGRYTGCPTGYQTYPFSLLRQAAGALDLSGLGTSGSRPLGSGRAYILLAPKDPPPPTTPDPVAYRHTVKVLVNGLAVRARPRTSAAKLAHKDRGDRIHTTKLYRHAGAYRGPGGNTRTDWLAFTNSRGVTVWVARAFTRVVD